MPYFRKGNARIYFIEQGRGFPIIAVHGLIENTAYWRLPGVADRLSDKYHVVSMDMRGHGNTRVIGKPPGYDAETIGADIIALADHLGFRRFHLLAHSTGGFAAVRRAMQDSTRFASLILTDTGSSTSTVNGNQEEIRDVNESFAQSFEENSWKEIFEGLRKKPGPFFRGIVEADRSEQMLDTAFEMARQNNRREIAEFVRTFYADPDTCMDALEGIDCPTFIVYGEKDDLFIESSRLMAERIPGACAAEYRGVGHMTAIEAPDRLTGDILAFLRDCTGCARAYG